MFKKKIFVSLTMKLLIVMLVAVGVALGLFFACNSIGNFLVWKYYLADNARETRLESYIEDLEQFARENNVSVNDAEKFAEWSGGKYVYAVLYKDSNLIYAPDWFDSIGADKEDDTSDVELTSTTDVGESEQEEQSSDELHDETVDCSGMQGDIESAESIAETSAEWNSETNFEDETEIKDDVETEAENATETEKDGEADLFDDRDFDKYLNEEARAKYQETLDNILAGNAELVPINCVDGILLATVVDYSEEFVYNIVFVASLICSIAVVLVIMFFNLSTLTSRVKKLAEKVRLVEKGNINTPLRVSGNDEIASLAEDVNSMRNAVVDNMTREQQAWEANAGLITAISHDIRTPLTVLLGYLDLMELQDENSANREYIEVCKDNAMRLKSLSDDMFSYFLVFGQKDNIAENMEVQSIEALKHIISERVFLMEENGYSFIWEDSITDISVRVDTMFMNRVIDNIFSNISKYALEEAGVVIRFESDGKELGVSFENKIKRNGINAESNHIGIKTCERIMEKMGGRFDTINDGDSFCARFTLPVCE